MSTISLQRLYQDKFNVIILEKTKFELFRYITENVYFTQNTAPTHVLSRPRSLVILYLRRKNVQYALNDVYTHIQIITCSNRFTLDSSGNYVNVFSLTDTAKKEEILHSTILTY